MAVGAALTPGLAFLSSVTAQEVTSLTHFSLPPPRGWKAVRPVSWGSCARGGRALGLAVHGTPVTPMPQCPTGQPSPGRLVRGDVGCHRQGDTPPLGSGGSWALGREAGDQPGLQGSCRGSLWSADPASRLCLWPLSQHACSRHSIRHVPASHEVLGAAWSPVVRDCRQPPVGTCFPGLAPRGQGQLLRLPRLPAALPHAPIAACPFRDSVSPCVIQGQGAPRWQSASFASTYLQGEISLPWKRGCPGTTPLGGGVDAGTSVGVPGPRWEDSSRGGQGMPPPCQPRGAHVGSPPQHLPFPPAPSLPAPTLH